MPNVRPAGMSSDEYDSDDDYDYYVQGVSDKKPSKANNYFVQPLPIKPEDALFLAIENNNIQEVKEILAKGISLEILQGGWTPLMVACYNGLPEITRILLDKGSDIKFHKDYFTPLMAVCSKSTGDVHNKLKCIRILLERQMDINAVDRFRISALMFATKEGLKDVVRMLIENGCKIDHVDKDGWSALFYAVHYYRVDIVDILIESGASITLKDLRNRSLCDIAIYKGFEELAEKLKVNEEEQETSFFSVQPVVTMSQMLNELPSKNCGDNPGFPTDVYNLLQGMDLTMYAKCFLKHNTQLGEFLTMDDNKLKNIGVIFTDHRKSILKSIRRFHMHKWQKSSLTIKSKYQTLELLDGVKIMGNVVRQLYVLQSTMNYVLANRQVNNITEELKKTINEIRKISDYTEREIIMIRDYSKYIDQVKIVRPADLITSDDNRAKSISKVQKVVKVCLTVALVFVLLWKQKKVIIRSPIMSYT